MKRFRLSTWWRAAIVTVALLGILAIGSLFLLDQAGGVQRQTHAISDEVLGLQRDLSAFHAQLDERLSGHPLQESGDAWATLASAHRRLGAMLDGGVIRHGLLVTGVGDPEIRTRIDGILSLLTQLENYGLRLESDPGNNTYVSTTDTQLHELYQRLQTETNAMEDGLHRILEASYRRSRLFFQGLIGVWGFMIAFTLGGLVRLGRAQRRAEFERAVLATFPELNPDPVVEVDSLGTIYYENPGTRLSPSLQNLGPSHPFLAGVASVAQELRDTDRTSAVRQIRVDSTWYEQTLHQVAETRRIRIYAHDITERKRTDEALRESEKKYRQLFNLAQEGIWVIDADGNTAMVNKSMANMLGYTVEEMLGRPLQAFMDEEGVALAEKNLERRRQGVSEQHDFALMKKDGSRLYSAMETAPIFDADGNYAGAIAGVIDISDRKRAEETLKTAYDQLEQRVQERTAELRKTNQELEAEIAERREAETLLTESKDQYKRLFREFNALLDAIQDPLLLLSPRMKILWGNQAAASGLTRDRAELTDFHCHDLLHGRTKPCDECPVGKSLRTGKAESSQISSTEGRILELRAYPVLTEEEEPFNVILTVSDATETLSLQAEALRTAHLASLGEMAAGVAHEINNPINGIINYSQILANLSGDGTETQDLANRIMKEGDRIAVIVRSLLSFARDRKEDKGRVRVTDVLEDSLALVSAQMRKDGIALSVDVPQDLPGIVAHPQQIQQVFLNLLNNARYALNKKYPAGHPDKRLQIIGRRWTAGDVPFVRLIFMDYGPGIPRGIIKTVLNPFFSTKPRGEGTGLGLSISHGIITDHGGKLSLESVEGNFTKVIVDLPVAGLSQRTPRKAGSDDA